jgi:polar amino acid transport system substrate-binding protein
MLLAGPVAADCVMNVRMDDDPPYLTTLSDGRPGGVHADIAREALRRIGCKAEFHELPFTRSLKDLAEGVIDILPNLFSTPERQAFARFSRTRDQVPNRLFMRTEDKERSLVRSFDDLARFGLHIGYEAGALISPDFPQMLADPRFKDVFVPGRTHESLWRMLVAHRIDGVIMDEQTARWELVHLGFAGSVSGADFIAATAPAYYAFSRASVTAEQVQAFDAAVSSMRKDGTLAAILTKYGLEESAAIDIAD